MQGCEKCRKLGELHTQKEKEVSVDKEFIELGKKKDKLEEEIARIDDKMWRIYDRIVKPTWIKFVREHNSHVEK